MENISGAAMRKDDFDLISDRRYAAMLAELHRAGELSAVWVPDAAHEAMRNLVRTRETAVPVASKARQHR